MKLHHLTSLTLAAAVAVAAAGSLTGCSDLQGKLNAEITDSMETIVADLMQLGLSDAGDDAKQIASQVSDAIKEKSDKNNVEANAQKALESGKLSDMDKLFITYQLARLQMYTGKTLQAQRNFQAAIAQAETMKASDQIMEALYNSYSVCLEKGGDKSGSAKYKAKYDALAAKHQSEKKAGETAQQK
jgi:hypothetical protein